MTTWKCLKWGAKNHPGNPFYLIMCCSFWVAAFANDNIKSGIIAATACTIAIAILYVITSISVGKYNQKLVDEEE